MAKYHDELINVWKFLFIMIGVGIALLTTFASYQVLNSANDIRARADIFTCVPRPHCMDNGRCPRLKIPNVCPDTDPKNLGIPLRVSPTIEVPPNPVTKDDSFCVSKMRCTDGVPQLVNGTCQCKPRPGEL